jgi:hypothetical protein
MKRSALRTHREAVRSLRCDKSRHRPVRRRSGTAPCGSAKCKIPPRVAARSLIEWWRGAMSSKPKRRVEESATRGILRKRPHWQE